MKPICIAVLGAVVALSACGGDSNPIEPSKPTCEVHNTATLTIVNSSTNLLPRNVELDGTVLGVLPYGSQLQREVSAGVAHPVTFRSTSSGFVVSTASPNLIQCSTFTLTNTF
jgi:hypothetical protein